MKPLSLLSRLHLLHCSKPKADRGIYRFMLHHKPVKIVEIGIGPAVRSCRMLTLAASYAETEAISYTGVDLFEARSASEPGITLKRAHRLLSPMAGKVRLIPGDPNRALMQAANALGQIDLLLISADQDPASLAPAWFYVPRMLHDTSVVLVEVATAGKAKFQAVPHDEIRRLAAAAHPKRRAA